MKNLILGLLAYFAMLSGFAQKHDEGSHKGSGHSHHHHIAVFNGLGSNIDHKSTDYAVGLDYLYLFDEHWAVGVLGEYVAAHLSEIVIGVPVAYRFGHGFKTSLVPAMLHVEGGDDGHGHVKDDSWHFLMRANIAYEFHFHSLSIGPSVSFDISETKAFIYGINIGFGF